ncbi:MAG: DUF1835 domain-containing protein [Cyclobacteriaceae bacterium]
MSAQYHILNGDTLKDQFPEAIEGQILVVRECLVDGDVTGDSLSVFFENRARFIASNYPHIETDYFQHVVPEFEKILKIPAGASVNFWFEDDLFCQVNFWFVQHLLYQAGLQRNYFLVRPSVHTRFGFSGLSQTELLSIYQHKLALRKEDVLASLWQFYQENDHEELLATARKLQEYYPFVLEAVNAHLERIPSGNNPGRPMQSLMKIMDEFAEREFGPIFQEFCERESIYGFGDLQVKKMYDHILANR